MSLKNRLSTVQKQLYNLTSNIKTYKKQAESLRQTKQSFEKSFDARNTDIKRNLTNELERIHQELKRHLTHHKSQNGRIRQQIEQLNLEKQNYQTFLKNIREKLQDIERQVGE